MYNPTTEDQNFKPKINKNCRLNRSHHIGIKAYQTYIEATKNAVEIKEQNNNKNKNYKNLIKGERTEN